MKKIFAIFFSICLMASVLCISAFAEDMPELAPGTVLRLVAVKKDGTETFVGDYSNFEDGWNHAMSSDVRKEYARIIVDFYADWNADANCDFTDDFWNNGPGFDWDTIYIPDDTRVTVNLNGHTVNRKLKSYEYDGEVIYIDEDADVIINNGTITGGWSCNGAGGIHIHDADVVLNNVNVIGNVVEDDDGGAIALYDGASLTMNGGSIVNNTVKSTNVSWVFAAGVYVEKSTASFTDVTFSGNHSSGRYEYKRDQTETYSSRGVAIYATDANVTVDSCKFYNNATHHGNFLDAESVICVRDSEMTVKKTVFNSNGDVQHFTNGQHSVYLSVMLFDVGDSDLKIEECQFISNAGSFLFDSDKKSYLNITDSSFTGNFSAIYRGSVASAATSSFVGCTFNKNSPTGNHPHSFEFSQTGEQPTFADCDFGNSTFNDRSKATIDGEKGTGAILGNGSLAVIVAFGALTAAVASGGVCIPLYKRMAALESVENAIKPKEEDEDDE